MYVLSRQAEQQRLGGIDIAVATGHVRDGIDVQFPVQLGRQHGAIRARACNRAVGNGHRVHARLLERPCSGHEPVQAGVCRRVQLDGDHALARPEFIRQAVADIARHRGRLLFGGNRLDLLLVERLCRQTDMFGRRAAAATDDLGTRGDDLHHAGGEIPSTVLKERTAIDDRRIPGVGHDAQHGRLCPRALFAKQAGIRPRLGQQMVGPGHAVEPGRVDERTLSRARKHRTGGQALAGKSIGRDRKGGDKERLRAARLDIGCKTIQVIVIRKGLKQEVLRTERQKLIHNLLIFPVGVGDRPNIRKDEGAVRLCGLLGQFPARTDNRAHPVEAALERVGIGGKGVGLDGAGARFQIRLVHSRDLFRRSAVGQLAFARIFRVHRPEIGAHCAVKQQHLML